MKFALIGCGRIAVNHIKADCPVTQRLCRSVLSLPMHPYMTKADVELVSRELKRALAQAAEVL